KAGRIGQFQQSRARRRLLQVLDDDGFLAAVADHGQGVARGAAARIVVDRDLAHARVSVLTGVAAPDARGSLAGGANRCRERLTIATSDSITGTSTSTPTTVARAAPECRPNSEIATATASSKKLEVPIRHAGPAMSWRSFSARAATKVTRKIPYDCSTSGTAIMPITSGCSRMVRAWKPNSSTTVAMRPTTDHGLSRPTNSATAAGERRSSMWRVATPASSGSTTYSTVDSSSVCHGTLRSVTPSRNAAIGANATTMIRSFTDTCTSV